MSVAVSEALFESANAVHSLGEEGKKVEKSGGDFVSDHLLADSASEEALRDRIDKWGNEAGFKASIWGEEIGKNVEVGDRNSKNISFWTIDGLQNFINWAQKDENGEIHEPIIFAKNTKILTGITSTLPKLDK